MRRLRIPIRLKLLVALLFVVTAVVSVITFTMANLFHDDKETYIKSMIAVASISAAEEGRTLLDGYADRLQIYARIMGSASLTQDERSSLLKNVFSDFPELVSVNLIRDGKIISAAFDRETLTSSGLSEQKVNEYYEVNPLPLDQLLAGGVFVRNATLSPSLPVFTLALAQYSEDDDVGSVVSALIRTNSLQRLAERSRIYELFFVDAAGVLLAHPDRMLVSTGEPAPHMQQKHGIEKHHLAEVTSEYEVDGVPMLGGSAEVGVGGVKVVAQTERAKAYLASQELLATLVRVALALLLVTALVSLTWSRRFTRPIERLSGATRKIAKGEFEVEVHVPSGDEIGALANSFNQMASELKSREEALTAAQEQLIQSEKMSAFGQIGAGIAHEVKNPLAGILGCAQLSLRGAEEDSPLRKNLLIIEKETKRCRTIIENLMRFARQEEALKEPMDVNTVIEQTMDIVGHQLEITQVRLERDLAENLPSVNGNSNQLEQVLINLMINAQQAMEGRPGSVRVISRATEDDQVEIRVVDDGPGMAEETRRKLFEPFFTTKIAGKGTGLGLSVSYGIVKDHLGDIKVESELGSGATFIITLPVPSDPEATGRPISTKTAAEHRTLTHA